MTDEQIIAVRQHAVTSAVTLYDGPAKPISVIMDAVRTIEAYVLGADKVPARASE